MRIVVWCHYSGAEVRPWMRGDKAITCYQYEATQGTGSCKPHQKFVGAHRDHIEVTRFTATTKCVIAVPGRKYYSLIRPH